MVHLPHTPHELARVGRTVRLPVPAKRAPSWPSIGLAYEDVLAIESLQSRAIGILVDGQPEVLRLFIVSISFALGEGFALVYGGLSALVQRDESGIYVRGDEGSEVGSERQEEEDDAENDERDGCSMLALVSVKIVNCGTTCQRIAGASGVRSQLQTYRKGGQ